MDTFSGVQYCNIQYHKREKGKDFTSCKIWHLFHPALKRQSLDKVYWSLSWSLQILREDKCSYFMYWQGCDPAFLCFILIFKEIHVFFSCKWLKICLEVRSEVQCQRFGSTFNKDHSVYFLICWNPLRITLYLFRQTGDWQLVDCLIIHYYAFRQRLD